MRLQTACINGTHGLSQKDAPKYYSKSHFDLVKKLVILRQEFRRNRNHMKAKQEIAQEELTHWLNYVEQRKEALQGDKTHWI